MKAIQHFKFQVMKLRAHVEKVRDQALCFFNPIRTEEDHRRALWDICALWDAQPNTPEGKKLDRLALFVDNYERKNISNFWGKD
jgi:hypothetical protein